MTCGLRDDLAGKEVVRVILTQSGDPSEDKTSVPANGCPFVTQVIRHKQGNVFTGERSGKLVVGVIIVEGAVEVPVCKFGIGVHGVVSYLQVLSVCHVGMLSLSALDVLWRACHTANENNATVDNGCICSHSLACRL